MGYKVYILYSERLDKYYVGQTDDVEKRFAVHNSGGKKYTTMGIPWVLIKTYGCDDRSNAIKLEQKIKKRGIQRYITEN